MSKMTFLLRALRAIITKGNQSSNQISSRWTLRYHISSEIYFFAFLTFIAEFILDI